MTTNFITLAREILLKFLLCACICLLIPACGRKDSPKGEWILDCGMVDSEYGKYQMIHHMNLDLKKPTIVYGDGELEPYINTYGTWNFSTLNKIYSGYIDSVGKVSKNVYILRMVDTAWDEISLDTLYYDPIKKTYTLSTFGRDNFFVKDDNPIASSEPTAVAGPVKDNSPLITWILIIGVILLVLCIGIKFSGELDGWAFAIPLTVALAVLVSIVAYNIVVKDIVPGQLQPTQADGISALLWLYGSMLAVSLAYFWGVNLIRNGVAEDYGYVSLRWGIWVVILLVINTFLGLATEFQSFRDLSSDFIGAITFKGHFLLGLSACSLAAALLFAFIQIFIFYRSLEPLIATAATGLFFIYVVGSVAFCVGSIPTLILVAIVFFVGVVFFNGASTVAHSSGSSHSGHRSSSNDSPDEIEFTEPGSIAHTSARHIGCDIYMTSDGRKFIKEGDSVSPYEP